MGELPTQWGPHTTTVGSVSEQENRFVSLIVLETLSKECGVSAVWALPEEMWGRAVGRRRWLWLEPTSRLLSVHKWR